MLVSFRMILAPRRRSSSSEVSSVDALSTMIISKDLSWLSASERRHASVSSARLYKTNTIDSSGVSDVARGRIDPDDRKLRSTTFASERKAVSPRRGPLAPEARPRFHPGTEARIPGGISVRLAPGSGTFLKSSGSPPSPVCAGTAGCPSARAASSATIGTGPAAPGATPHLAVACLSLGVASSALG